jgi:hypothetical protein
VPAHAIIVENFSVTPDGAFWMWTYNASWGSIERVESVGVNPGVTTPTIGSLSSDFQDYFTIYDFFGYVPGTEFAPPGWEFEAANVGSTPASQIINPSDSPTIVNLTWHYDAGAPLVGAFPAPGDPPYLFGADSTELYGVLAAYAYDSTKNAPGPNNGFKEQGTGSLVVPRVVPEPSTFVLLGAGLLGAAIMKRRGKK